MKTIEEHRKEIQSLAEKSVKESVDLIHSISEEIMIAFMAKYKLSPEQCVLKYQGNKFWVEKKDEK
jgi:predicted Holliday junction resolvase-like endonuclease